MIAEINQRQVVSVLIGMLSTEQRVNILGRLDRMAVAEPFHTEVEREQRAYYAEAASRLRRGF